MAMTMTMTMIIAIAIGNSEIIGKCTQNAPFGFPISDSYKFKLLHVQRNNIQIVVVYSIVTIFWNYY